MPPSSTEAEPEGRSDHAGVAVLGKHRLTTGGQQGGRGPTGSPLTLGHKPLRVNSFATGGLKSPNFKSKPPQELRIRSISVRE